MKYKGFKIKYGMSCWGDCEYFVYNAKGQQMFDGVGSQSEAKELINEYMG